MKYFLREKRGKEERKKRDYDKEWRKKENKRASFKQLPGVELSMA